MSDWLSSKKNQEKERSSFVVAGSSVGAAVDKATDVNVGYELAAVVAILTDASDAIVSGVIDLGVRPADDALQLGEWNVVGRLQIQASQREDRRLLAGLGLHPRRRQGAHRRRLDTVGQVGKPLFFIINSARCALVPVNCPFELCFRYLVCSPRCFAHWQCAGAHLFSQHCTRAAVPYTAVPAPVSASVSAQCVLVLALHRPALVH